MMPQPRGRTPPGEGHAGGHYAGHPAPRSGVRPSFGRGGPDTRGAMGAAPLGTALSRTESFTVTQVVSLGPAAHVRRAPAHVQTALARAQRVPRHVSLVEAHVKRAPARPPRFPFFVGRPDAIVYVFCCFLCLCYDTEPLMSVVVPMLLLQNYLCWSRIVPGLVSALHRRGWQPPLRRLTGYGCRRFLISSEGGRYY